MVITCLICSVHIQVVIDLTPFIPEEGGTERTNSFMSVDDQVKEEVAGTGGAGSSPGLITSSAFSGRVWSGLVCIR